MKLMTVLLTALVAAGTQAPAFAAEGHDHAAPGAAKEQKPCHMMLAKGGKPAKEGKQDCRCDAKGKNKGKHGHRHGHGADTGHGAKGADLNAATRAYAAANAVMHKEMDITYTGDADVDFLRGMIAHHAGAVKMAEVQLEHGKNPQVKRLAREIIRAQNLEIRWMEAWLGQLDKDAAPKTRRPAASSKYHDEAWTGGNWMGER